MKKTLPIFLFILLIPALKLMSQENIQLPEGAKVRVRASGLKKQSLQGRLILLKADTLELQINDRTESFLAPTNSISKLEIWHGEKRFGLSKGAGLGFFLGATVGAAIGFSTDTSGECLDSICEVDDYLPIAYAIMGGGVGALAGTYLGATIKQDEWREVPLTELGINRDQSSEQTNSEQ